MSSQPGADHERLFDPSDMQPGELPQVPFVEAIPAELWVAQSTVDRELTEQTGAEWLNLQQEAARDYANLAETLRPDEVKKISELNAYTETLAHGLFDDITTALGSDKVDAQKIVELAELIRTIQSEAHAQEEKNQRFRLYYRGKKRGLPIERWEKNDRADLDFIQHRRNVKSTKAAKQVKGMAIAAGEVENPKTPGKTVVKPGKVLPHVIPLQRQEAGRAYHTSVTSAEKRVVHRRLFEHLPVFDELAYLLEEKARAARISSRAA